MSTTSSTRGPYAKTPEFRDAVLDTTLRMVDEVGYEELTFTAVARECGMSKAGLLYHFGSWHDLLIAALERRRQLDRERILELSSWSDAFARTFEHNSQVPGAVALFTALAGHAAASPNSDSSGRQFFERHYAEAVHGFSESVRADQAAGKIDPAVDPEAIVRILIAMSDGMQIQWLLDPTVDMAEHFELFSRMVTQGLAPNSTVG